LSYKYNLEGFSENFGKNFILSVVLDDQHVVFYKDEKEIAKVDCCALNQGYRFYVGLKGFCTVNILDLESQKETK
jgi:hypothetical protein